MTSALIVRHGYLYLADLNPRMGTEAGKVRPVVVLQTDLLNAVGHPSTWVIPCTTRLVGENALRVPLPAHVSGNNEDCEVMIDQSRTIDNRRLKKMLGRVPAVILKDIKTKLRQLGEL